MGKKKSEGDVATLLLAVIGMLFGLTFAVGAIAFVLWAFDLPITTKTVIGGFVFWWLFWKSSCDS